MGNFSIFLGKYLLKIAKTTKISYTNRHSCG